MSKTITVEIYSPRWKHPDPYTFVWTPTGWNVDSGGHNFQGLNKDGTNNHNGNNEVLFIMDNDDIKVPFQIGPKLEDLWDLIDKGESDPVVQNSFDLLADSINSNNKK